MTTFDDYVSRYASGEKRDRVRADHEIKQAASSFDLPVLLRVLSSDESSVAAKTAAALAIGYHEESSSEELRILYEALDRSKGEAAAFAYRVLSAIRKLLARGIRFDGINRFYHAVNHYRVAGGKDTRSAAIAVHELMRRPPESAASASVFIVHGRDELNLLRLERLLREHWHLDTIILRYRPGIGRTLIEKFEEEAEAACFAFALFTSDDLIQAGDTDYFQARPNAIFELGWFYGRLGRAGVCILFKHGTTVPSDLEGISHIEFRESVVEKAAEIEAELHQAGLLRPAQGLR